MKKPANLVYGVDDSPPLAVIVFNGVQHVSLIAINLVYPLLVFRVADTPVQALTNLMAIGMLVLGVATFLQALRLGPVGSGYMCPATFRASYFPASLLAAKLGGLPLVFGMTIFAGVLEAALAPLLNRLRAIFPIEISGLVIFMIGWSAGIAGLRLLLGTLADPVSAAEWSVAGITLATMVALNVWGKGPVRMLCALVNRATFGVIQLVDAVRGEFWHRGAIEIEASFDEFSLDVDLVYDGDELEFPEQRPSNKEIRESENGARLMAGFMLRKCADRLRSKCKDGRANVHMHYDH